MIVFTVLEFMQSIFPNRILEHFVALRKWVTVWFEGFSWFLDITHNSFLYYYCSCWVAGYLMWLLVGCILFHLLCREGHHIYSYGTCREWLLFWSIIFLALYFLFSGTKIVLEILVLSKHNMSYMDMINHFCTHLQLYNLTIRISQVWS